MDQFIKNSLQIKEIMPSQSMAGAHLFNTTKFLLTKPFNVMGWQLVGHRPLAQIFFTVQETQAISGFQATFGSFDFSIDINKNELLYFVNQVLFILKSKGVKGVLIKNYPAYMDEDNLVDRVLKMVGFANKVSEINQHIIISSIPFLKRIKPNEKRKINQCLRKSYRFYIESVDNLTEIYNLINDTRKRKGYAISMQLYQLENVIKKCADNYILFTLRDGNKLIAACISVLINKKIIYNFYPADALSYRTKSPLTLLIKHIYEYAQVNNYQYLDLGTSSVSQVVNEGLYKFKSNLGAQESKKTTYYLSL